METSIIAASQRVTKMSKVTVVVENVLEYVVIIALYNSTTVCMCMAKNMGRIFEGLAVFGVGFTCSMLEHGARMAVLGAIFCDFRLLVKCVDVLDHRELFWAIHVRSGWRR